MYKISKQPKRKTFTKYNKKTTNKMRTQKGRRRKKNKQAKKAEN